VQGDFTKNLYIWVSTHSLLEVNTMSAPATKPIMPPLTPEAFWSFYKKAVQESGSWRAYQDNPSWTTIAKSAAESVCRNQFGLQTGREYFRVDVVGWTGRSDYDYDLRVAFEAENTKDWEDELCRLAHIVSDLRVLVAYQSHRSRRAEKALDEYLIRHKDRVLRDRNCRWLFIFRPILWEPKRLLGSLYRR